MKIIISVVLFLSTFSLSTYSQFILEINSSKLNACQDSTVQFTAKVTSAGLPESDVNYLWSFGDESAEISGLNLDTVKHKFTKGGGFIIRVDADKGVDSDYALYEFEVALTPNFSGTKSDKPDPICLGQTAILSGQIADSTWRYQIPDLLKEAMPVEIVNTRVYQKIHDYRIFAENQTLLAASDIDSIGVELEHSNLNQIKIELICPSGNSIILKDFGGAVKYFGEPIIGGNPDLQGIAYKYYWTNSPVFGTMNSTIPAGNSLQEGNYTSEQSFALLSGCHLNGEWKIKISDNQLADSGFVFSIQLTFNSSLLPSEWTYKHIYSFPQWIGNGVSSTSGDGLAAATPTGRNNYGYTYKVNDNFGCPQDTIINVRVEPVTFTVSPTETEFGKPVDFENTTSWAVDYIWDFDDDSEFGEGSPTVHTYLTDGEFWAQLTAISAVGCQDTSERILIKVTIPKAKLESIPNVFTPNGDGKNDSFRIPAESMEGIKSLDCKIYSRWGKKVAEWNSVEDAEIGWDGNFGGGQKATPGVYYYVLKAEGFDGTVYDDKNGSFQLLR